MAISTLRSCSARPARPDRGSRKLTELGVDVLTASRSGSDVRFDWDNTSTIGPALRGAEAVCLVAPVLRLDFAGQVAAFLDFARRAGVRHAKGAVL